MCMIGHPFCFKPTFTMRVFLTRSIRPLSGTLTISLLHEMSDVTASALTATSTTPASETSNRKCETRQEHLRYSENLNMLSRRGCDFCSNIYLKLWSQVTHKYKEKADPVWWSTWSSWQSCAHWRKGMWARTGFQGWGLRCNRWMVPRWHQPFFRPGIMK